MSKHPETHPIHNPRRWNGWGGEHTEFPLKEKGVAFLIEKLQGKGSILPDATLAQVLVKVPATRIAPHRLVSTDAELRVRHARGQGYPDWLAYRSGELGRFPDGVALPTNSDEVREVLSWAYENDYIIIIYSGGTSVLGHLDVPESDKPVLSLSLEKMDQLLSFDKDSQVATFGSGTPGPSLERQLAALGYTLGHYPQSWELSTVGGWAASRSSGQQSLRYGRIEQMFAGARVETPTGGTWIIPDVPASSAGTDLREMIMGSEGRMGAITEVKVRVTPLPEHESFHVAFVPDWEAGLKLVKAVTQGKVQLSMMRLSNPAETTSHLALGGEHPLFNTYEKIISLRGCRDGERCMFTFGATGSNRQVKFAVAETKRILRAVGGTALASGFMGKIWEHSRFRAPYFRFGMWTHGWSVDTVETSVNWSRVTDTMNAVEQALRAANEGEPIQIFTHLSHFYAQGCSIYTSFLFKNSDTYEKTYARWRKIKEAASAATVRMGGTISHQHGVGRDHAPWMHYEKGMQGMGAIKALTEYFDPKAQMNPGVMLADEQDWK